MPPCPDLTSARPNTRSPCTRNAPSPRPRRCRWSGHAWSRSTHPRHRRRPARQVAEPSSPARGHPADVKRSPAVSGCRAPRPAPRPGDAALGQRIQAAGTA
jgi:hypothetical protein